MFLLIDKYLKTVQCDVYNYDEININSHLPYMMRLKHNCEKCGALPSFELYGMQYQVSLFMIPIAKHFKEYFIKCCECHVTLLIDYEEYRTLKKISKKR